MPESLFINLSNTKRGTISSVQRYKIICNAEKTELEFPIITICAILYTCNNAIEPITTNIKMSPLTYCKSNIIGNNSMPVIN